MQSRRGLRVSIQQPPKEQQLGALKLYGSELTVRVLDHNGVGHDGVALTVLVLSTDSELILVSFDEFLHRAVSDVSSDVGGDQRPIGPASLTFLNDVVGDLRASVCKWGLPSQLNTVCKHLTNFH